MSDVEEGANNLNRMIIIFMIAFFLLLVMAQWASAYIGGLL